uniref:Methyltransferase n=1 Tax=Uromyces virgavirus C TaxID=2592726 RepID=A0A7G3KFC7_9VIRU|nr:hypothetical protein [Uromyces virgavirus C]
MPEVGGPQISHDDIVAVLRRQQAYSDLSDEELGIFADAQLRTKGSAARVAMASYSSTAQLVLARSRVLQVKTTIPMLLTSAEKNVVRSAFPERDFLFTDMDRHDHGLAAAMRKIDRQILRERLPLRCRVVDVGGDFVYNLLSEETPIHSCCPTVDPKDRFRAVERTRRLKTLACSPNVSDTVKTRIRDFMTDTAVEAQWTCQRKVEECRFRADHLIMTHVYDMTLEQVAAAVLAHGAEALSGCLILSADMLERDQGQLPSVNGWYSLDTKTQIMTYGTNNGSSWHYKHNWRELRRFSHDCVVFVNMQAVAYRVSEVRGQTLFFEVWPLKCEDTLFDQPRRAFQVSGGPWARVEGYQFVAERSGLAYSRPRACTLRYPWETWSRAMEYARGQIANGRFTMEDYARKMRTLTARLTINSVAVTGVEAINEDQFADFLSNSALAAVYEVEKEKVDMQAAVAGIHSRRDLVGPWGRTLRGFKAFLERPITEGVGWLNSLHARLKLVLLDRVRVVTYERDDGSRVINVSQFPDGTVAVTPYATIMEYKDEDTAKETPEVTDLVTAACMRDPVLAARMREVLDATLAAPPTQVTDTYQRIIADLAQIVGCAEDAVSQSCAESVEAVTTETAVDAAPASYKGKAREDKNVEFVMQPIAGQDQQRAREVALSLGVTDLLPSDEVGAFTLSEVETNSYYKDAMAEAIRLYNAEERRATAECTSVFAKTTVGGRPSKHLLDLLQGDCLKPDYYDVVHGRIVTDSYRGVPRALFSHSAVFLPPLMSVFRIDRQDDEIYVVGKAGYSGLALVIDALTIFNGPEIRDAIAVAIERFDINNFTIVIRDGVPGCGKTTQIIRGARYDDLILASGKENTVATRKKKIELDRELAADAAKIGVRFVPFQNPAKRIRTYDSYLMSRTFERAEVVHADECFMQHSGKLLAAAVMSGARRIEFHGDTMQVPFVPRHTEDKCYRSKLIFRHLHTKRYISHRCPQDAVAAIAPQYEYKIRTTSSVVRSLSMITDMPLDAVPWDKTKKYLTIYQDDKATAAKKCRGNPVNTVAESQGETYDHVVFVRQQARKQDLYDSWPYVLVGLSRHTQSMEYTAPSATGSLFENRIKAVVANEEYSRQFGEVSTAGVATVVKL